MKREKGEKGEVRSSGFEVPKTSNFGPRTLARLTYPISLARLSCGSVLLIVPVVFRNLFENFARTKQNELVERIEAHSYRSHEIDAARK